MIKISDTARSHLLDMLNMSNQRAVLLSISSKGCGGHTYQMEFSDYDQTDDLVALDENHFVVIDKKSAKWLIGVEMDFVDNGLDSHFEFDNPAEVSRCGCNQSFRVT